MAEPKSLVEAQTELLRNPIVSDMTIKCRGREWECCSGILTQRCDFFRAIFEGSFKESQTRIIELKDDDPKAVDYLLLYLYTLAPPDIKTFDMAESIFNIGDKYDIAPMRDAGTKWMTSNIYTKRAKWRKCSGNSKKFYLNLVPRLWAANMEAAIDVRNALLAMFVAVAAELLERDDFEEIMLEHPDFRKDFMKELVREARGGW